MSRWQIHGGTHASTLSVTDLLQLLLNGIVSGATLAVPAIGITAIYAVLRFPNFALSSVATIGAFAGYVANSTFGLPIAPAALFGFVVAGLVGIVADDLVLKPIRPTGPLAAAIASVALAIALENVVRLCFGNDLTHFPLAIGIESTGWFVQDQKLWIGQQRLSNTQALEHALGVSP